MYSSIKGKNVLFITTKNTDYIRNTQEISILRKNSASLKVIGSASKNYLLRILCVYFSLFFTSAAPFDVIFIGFAPQLILPIFHFKFRKKYIIEDFFISMYDTFCLDRQKFSARGLLGRILHHIDSLTLRYGDKIISDTKAHGQFFVKEFQAEENKLFTLYLEADKELYHPMDNEKPDFLQGRFTVLYFGSVLPLQGVDVVLKAYDIVKDTPGITCIFVGPISDSKLLAAKPQSENILYIDWLPQNELASLIHSADLCLAGHFNADIDKAKRTIPGKAYIYHAMEKPMILGENPANHELFDVSDPLITFVEMGNPVALANAILSNIE